MQNKLRKALALLVSVLMLCTLLPLGAMSVAAADETILSMDFENGDVGFTSGSGQSIVVDPDDSANHVLYWSTSGYESIYKVVTLEKNTDYVFNFKMKTSAGKSCYITVQDAGWGPYEQVSFSTKTTWTDHSIEFNTGDNLAQVMLKFQNGGATQEYWIDNFSVVKKEKAAAPEGGEGETTYEVVWEKDWNDGVLSFKSGSVVAEGPDGSNCMKWSANGGWSNTSYTLNGIEQNTDYLVRFKMKTSAAAKLFITMQAYSDGEYGNETFKTTSEWADYEMIINTKNYVNSEGKMRFKFQDTGVAQDVWVDDLYIAKIIEPEVEENENMVTNGSFENGSDGWKLKNTTIVSTDAHTGSNAALIENPEAWAEALVQTLDVTPGNNYELTFWAKRVSGSEAFNIIVCQGYSPYNQFKRLDGVNYMKNEGSDWVQHKLTYEAGSDTKMMLKFTSEANNAGSILIDDVSVIELKQPAYDGYIYNGDFETGNTNPWTVYSDTTVNKEAANNGKYGLMTKGNGAGYGGLAYQDFATEAGHRYAVSFSYKAVSSGVNVQIQQDGAKLASKYVSGTSWGVYTLEFDATGTTAKINICGSGKDVVDCVYFDDFKVVEVKNPSFDGYIWNGDFEAGSTTKWEINKETALSTTAAKNGKYGAILKGTANWGGLLTQRDIKVEVGKTYKLSFWYKTPKNGLNMTLKDQDNQNTKLAGNYLNGKSDWTLYEATFESGYVTKLILNFSGSGKAESNPSAIDELWIDDIKLECLSGDEMDRCEVLKNSGTSIRDVSDDNRGLAFRFSVNVTGAQFVKGNQYVSGSGSMKLFKYDEAIGTLIEAGAVVTNQAAIGEGDMTLDDVNGKNTIKVAAKYMTDYEDNGDMFFAVRIVNIPDEHVGTQIYARPYYIYEVQTNARTTEQVIVYGDAENESYEAVASVRRSLKILAIGNSFSVDAMKNHLYDVLKSADYDQVILGNLYVGGCSIDTHWNYISSNSGSYEYHKNDDNGKWVTTYGAKAMDALQDENWDIITVQQVSSNSGQPETFGNLQNLVNWVNQYKTNPNAKVLWHMTWAYQQDSTHEAFPNYGKDQMTMYNAIVNTVQNTVLNVDGIDGVIPAGTAIQNLRGAIGDNLTADGYHLNDLQGDYTASLTWYAAITGESLDLVDYAPAAIVNDVFNIKRAVGRAIIKPYEVSNMGETVLIAGSDFQASTWEKNINNINALRNTIQRLDGYSLFDGFLFAGDYTPNHGHDNATEGIGVLDEYTNEFVIGNKVYTEGNHDAPTVEMLSPSGNNDPVGGTYGVYVIHEEEYGQFGAGKSTELYDELKAYFAEKTASGWNKNKPIFVMTHVPLHFNWRTVSDYGGGKNAQYIVDALNEASEEGYNIIFLYGHNHSGDYDAYLGGASIYLAKGDTMLIANPANYKEWQEKEIKFTYLNAGYVGYHPDFGIGMDYALTMTTFQIKDDGSVIITRYAQDGYHVLKAKGVHHVTNEYVNDYPVNETVYGPKHQVTATTDVELIAP